MLTLLWVSLCLYFLWRLVAALILREILVLLLSDVFPSNFRPGIRGHSLRNELKDESGLLYSCQIPHSLFQI